MYDCDFLPPQYHQARLLRRALHLRLASIGGMVALMGLWAAVHEHRLTAASAMLAEVNSQRGQIRIHRARRDAMAQDRLHLADRQRLIDVIGEQVSLVAAFAEMSQTIPDNVLLTDLTVSGATVARFAREIGARTLGQGSESRVVPASRAVSARPGSPEVRADGPAPSPAFLEQARTRLVIKGAAKSTPDILSFAADLEDSALFDKVQLQVTGPGTLAGKKVQQFEMTCELIRRDGETPKHRNAETVESPNVEIRNPKSEIRIPHLPEAGT